LSQLLQDDLQRLAEVLFLERAAEFPSQRVRKFAVHHVHGYREGMPGPHGPGDEFQAVGKLLFKTTLPLPRLPADVHEGQGSADAGRGEGQQGRGIAGQQGEQEKYQ
jgi:hypothetical protein